MTEKSPESSDQGNQTEADKKTTAIIIVSVASLFIVMLFALVFILRGQMNERYITERYPVDQLEERLKQPKSKVDDGKW